MSSLGVEGVGMPILRCLHLPQPPTTNRQPPQDLVMDEVRKHFKPEFVNRIDEFIIFDPLRCGVVRDV